MFPCSSRNVHTAPGARGGHWHLAAFRKAYYRLWRQRHPEYRARDNERRAEAKHDCQLERDRQWVDELVNHG